MSNPGAITEIDAGMPADRATFERLADEWLEQRPKGVDVAQMIRHPAYQAIIDIGPNAVPWLLGRLAQRPPPNHQRPAGTTPTPRRYSRHGRRLDRLGQAQPATGTT